MKKLMTTILTIAILAVSIPIPINAAESDESDLFDESAVVENEYIEDYLNSENENEEIFDTELYSDEVYFDTYSLDSTVSLLSASDNEAYIYNFIINTMKLNNAAASGIIANLYCENGSFEPNRRQGGGTGFGKYNDGVGYGICQWTYWSRKQNLQTWCNKNTGSGSWSTLYGQLMFMQHELSGSTALKKLKKVDNSAKGAYEAGYAFCMHYERPKYYKSPYKGYPTESDYRGNIAQTKYWKKYGISKPAQPTISSAKADSSGSITVKWKAVSGATGYKVGIRKSGVESYTDYPKDSGKYTSDTSHTFTGLTPGTTYYFRLYAHNSAGTSPRSLTYTSHTKPNAPEKPTVTRDSATQLTVNWKTVSGATKYKIMYRRGDQSEYKILATNISSKTTSYVHKNLSPNARYWYRVYAIREGNVGVDGKYSKEDFTSDRSETGGSFTKIAAPGVTLNGNSVKLTWTKAFGANDYSYEVQRKDPNGSYKIITTTTALNYTDNSIKSGNIYKYKIHTIVTKDKGSCTWSDEFTVAPKIDSITVAPESVTSMKVSWAKPAGESNLSYAVYRSNGGQYSKIGTTSSTSYIDSNLTTGNTYKYYVDVLDKTNKVLTSTVERSALLEWHAEQVTLNKNLVNLNVGDTETLTATILPSNSIENTVTWSSSDSTVAEVSSTGVVTAKAEGEVTITASTSNNRKAECTVNVAAEEITEHEHTYGEWEVEQEATCTETGIRSRVCDVCGDKEIEIIPKTDHTYSDEWTTITEATCSEEGLRAHVCDVCGEHIDEEAIPTIEHSFGEWTVEKEATCSEEGTEVRECTVCGEKETKAIEKTEHEYEVTEVTETTPDGPGHITYTCKICGDSYSEENVPEVVAGIVEVGRAVPRPGESVSIPVSINENPGIAGFTFDLAYDNTALTPTGITAGALTEGMPYFDTNLDEGIPVSELDKVTVHWQSDNNLTDNGVLFNINFNVNSSALEGNYLVTLNYEKGEVTDENFNDVMPNVLGNVITIGDVIKGDINNDRIVDSRDCKLLSRYLANWKLDLTDKQLSAADMFGDGKITTKDGVRLAQIVAGYDLTEEETDVQTMSLMSASTANISVGSYESSAGEHIFVPVTIEDNTGIAGFNLRLNYDKDYLTPITIEAGDILTDGEFTSNITDEDETAGETEAEYITAVWSSADDLTEDGTLFVVEFEVNENAELNQKLPIELVNEDDEIINQSLASVSTELTQGEVSIVEDMGSEGDIDNPWVYNIFNITMELNDETVTEDIPINGDFDLTCEIESIRTSSNPAAILIAVYDTSNRLISVKSSDITAEMLTESAYKTHIDATTSNIAEIKAFVWNSLSDLTPLAEPLSTSDLEKQTFAPDDDEIIETT